MEGTIREIVRLSGTISGVGRISGSLSTEAGISGELTVPTVVERAFYDGEYTVTPADTAVVLETAELAMRQNVTINPIPSNYGLITWNGTTLTVS